MSVFKVAPRVLVDNDASRTHTVIEVNARDMERLDEVLGRALMEYGIRV